MDVAAFVEAAYHEARALLPAVPEGVGFDVDERAIVIPGWGVGGYALTGKRVLIGHDGSIAVLNRAYDLKLERDFVHYCKRWRTLALALGLANGVLTRTPCPQE